MHIGKPVSPITDTMHADPTLGERVLPTLLARLTMVGLAMAVVCWIGWFVPTSRQAEPRSPAAGFPVERGSSVPLRSKQSETPGHLSAERPMAPSSDQAARVTLDVNQATVQELEQLPGIGPVLAGRIVEDRKTRGAFRNVDHLRRVKGIGKKTFERIRAFIAVVPPVSMSGRKAA